MAGQDRAATFVVDESWLDSCVVVDRSWLDSCHRFSFFQAVRLLLQALPRSVPPGRLGPIADEAIRFRPDASLAFPTTDIAALEYSDHEAGLPLLLMTVTFLGLYGVESPLPTFYTEALLTAEPEDNTRRHFLDLFHHRLLSLFYRCWEKYRYDVQYQAGATDQLSQWLMALIGLGDTALRPARYLAWERLLPYLGLLSLRTMPAAVLARLISHYFGGIPVSIDQCVGRWVPFAPEQRHRLGKANHQLGETSTLGERFYDRSGKFRLTIGPVDPQTFQGFLPSGAFYHEVRALVWFAMRDPLDFEVEVRIRTAHVQPFSLSEQSWGHLGWSTWLDTPREDEVAVIFPGHTVSESLAEEEKA